MMEKNNTFDQLAKYLKEKNQGKAANKAEELGLVIAKISQALEAVKLRHTESDKLLAEVNKTENTEEKIALLQKSKEAQSKADQTSDESNKLAELMQTLLQELYEELGKSESKYSKVPNSKELVTLSDIWAYEKPCKDENGKDIRGKIAETTKYGVQTQVKFKLGELSQEGMMLETYARMKYDGSRIIRFNLLDYMEERGLVNRHETVRKIKEELEKLKSIDVSMKGTNRGSGFSLYGYHYENNEIELTPTTEMLIILEAAKSWVHYPKALLRINTMTNPYSFKMMKLFAERKGMNHKKANDDLFCIKELLAVFELPTYEEVKISQNRAYKGKIIRPFERDMNACKECFTWEYIEGSGKSWKSFSDAKIKLHWLNSPYDQRKLELKK